MRALPPTTWRSLSTGALGRKLAGLLLQQKQHLLQLALGGQTALWDAVGPFLPAWVATTVLTQLSMQLMSWQYHSCLQFLHVGETGAAWCTQQGVNWLPASSVWANLSYPFYCLHCRFLDGGKLIIG